MRIIDLIIRLVLSIIIGGMVGYEREFKNKTAGFRTHILVCVGATVISMIQLYLLQESANMIQQNEQLGNFLNADIGRLGAQVISGVGFLGAGAIIREKGSVKGLTTAASLWVVACIGLGVGLGYYALSLLSTFSVFIVLVLLKKFEDMRFGKSVEVQLQIDLIDMKKVIKDVIYYFNDRKIKIVNIEVDSSEHISNSSFTSIVYTILLPRNISINEIKEELYSSVDIINVKVL